MLQQHMSTLPVAEYGSFRSLLLLQKEVTLTSLMDACRLEETNRISTSVVNSSATALATSTSFQPPPNTPLPVLRSTWPLAEGL